ncbi:hypothetical protein, partial [Burkholderia pseudomallei]|uniref:hypothetical protein n=1 Tax=Burkholderia pseudomallei TaxID=28450 RepID=UPI001E487775
SVTVAKVIVSTHAKAASANPVSPAGQGFGGREVKVSLARVGPSRIQRLGDQPTSQNTTFLFSGNATFELGTYTQ